MPLAEGLHLYPNPYDIGAYENVTSVRYLLCSLNNGRVIAYEPNQVLFLVHLYLFARILLQILGPNYLCWVSPTSGNVSSGLRFSTKYHKANEN